VTHTEGCGPDLVFVHGTGRSGFELPIPLLGERVRITTYDRRGTAVWPLSADAELPTVGEHVADLIQVIVRLARGPVHVCGMSFGGVIALELARRRPDLVRSLVLFEPPVRLSDDWRPPGPSLLDAFKQLIAEHRPERAAELFHRRALSDAAWDSLPEQVQRRLRGTWRHIHADLLANDAHRPRWDELKRIVTPVLLLYGSRSRPAFELSLRALNAHLPCSRVAAIPSATHHVDAQAWRELATAVFEFLGLQ
jgi:pimeloyl-ACP methyl ester carboxylesterase